MIKALVQSCQEIVHVDPLSTPPRPHIRPSRRSSSIPATGAPAITEFYASTKAYPSWWSEIEESRLLRRRRSLSETVLDRNICFVDTPGLQSGAESASVVLDYLEGLFHKMHSMAEMSSSEVLGIVAGTGGAQVDVVLFFMSGQYCFPTFT